MTRRTFLKRTAKTLLGMGLLPYLPRQMRQAMAGALRPPVSPEPPPDGFQALIFCDSQCGYSYDVWEQTLSTAWAQFPRADFFTDIGDLTDNGEDDWQWQNFLDILTPYANAHPFYPVMGNHECYGQDWKNCLPRRYLKTFKFPANGTSRFHGYYYSFVKPPVQFVVLNTQMQELDEFFGPGRLLQAQLAWVKETLKNKTQPWTVVLMHKDVLAYDEYQASTGSTGGFSDVGRAFLPTLERLGVDLILTGHMHTYRRRGPIRNWQDSDSGPVCIMSGPAGNQEYYVPPDPLDKAAIAQPTEPNYLVMNASPQSLTISCLTVIGEEVDTIAIKKR